MSEFNPHRSEYISRKDLSDDPPLDVVFGKFERPHENQMAADEFMMRCGRTTAEIIEHIGG